MQILPGTWTWVEQQLAGRPLDPELARSTTCSAGVDVPAASCSRDAGGDEALARRLLLPGRGSVRAVGLLPDTQRYVANVMALRSRFGG